MLRIDNALRSDRVLKALTDLNIVEYIDLTARFEAVLAQRRRPVSGKKRQRRPGGGRKPELAWAEDKLFFILFYVKCYPTFDVAGVLFDAKGKDGFSPCSGCAIRPRQMARTMASDWDPAREGLSADSAARNY